MMVDTTATPSRSVEGHDYTGFGQLVRLNLRRDRVLLAVWVLVVGLLPAVIVSATRTAYPDRAAMGAFAAGSAASPSQLATRGPIFAVSVGGLTAWTLASSVTVVMGLVALLLTLRHSRADEEAGRLELIGSRPVGRRAALAAAMAIPASASLAVGALAVLGLLLQGLPLAGSLLLAAVLAGGGLVFVGIGGVVAQLSEGVAGARAIGLIILGLSFAVAAVGDLTTSPLVWLSPIGWARHAAAFAGDHGWVFLAQAATAALLAGVAGMIAVRRDLGAGVVQPRTGRATAAAWLTGPLALAWRRQRGQLIGWAVGLGLLGLLLGSVTGGVDAQLDSAAFRELSRQLGGGDVAQVFFQFVLYVLAQVATAAALAAVLTIRGDEVGGLAELLLVRRVRRSSWALAQWAVSGATGAAVLLGLGLLAGLSSGEFPGLIAGTLAYFPALLAVVGAGLALVGWLPRASVAASWTLLGLLIMLDLVGEFGLVSPTVMQISPFAATFNALITATTPAPTLFILTVIGLGLAGLGLLGLRRRDIGC